MSRGEIIRDEIGREISSAQKCPSKSLKNSNLDE